MQNIYQAKGETLEEQYRDVGKLFLDKIQESVAKIGKSRARLLNIRRMVAEKAWQNLKGQDICLEFVRYFNAWCEGACISPEQGMWLMADNLSGCQTMVARYASGVVLLHSEEEFRDTMHMELHMTSPHTIYFNDDGQILKTLVYNNLFPGAGLYGWQEDKIVAVDSIFLKEDGIECIERPVLANVVAWMVWKMRPEEAEAGRFVAMLKNMGTLVDGYVINVVRKVNVGIEGYKLIMARDESKIVKLGNSNGYYLKQVNIIDPSEVKMQCALPPRKMWRGGNKYFNSRINTLNNHAKMYRNLSERELSYDNLKATHQAIQQTIYGELCEFYVHADLGAVCVGFVDHNTGTSVSCKLNDGKDLQAIGLELC